jgi:oligopeptide transport system permease protein
MMAYTIRRLLWVIPVLWAIATITFFLMHAVPGGPFTQDRDLPESTDAALNRRYNLDEPLWKQYTSYLWNAAQGDLGLSFRGDQDVSEIIRERFFITAQIGVLAIVLAVFVGMLLGIMSSLNHNGPLDYIGVLFATIGASVPHFILATFLVTIFAVKFGWLQYLGWGGPQSMDELLHFGDYEWRRMVMPVVSLAALPAAYIARVTRASMLEVLNQDYIRTARAKGLHETRIILRHTVKNAMIPVLTVIGPLAAALIAGSFIIESMFNIPGIGQETIAAVQRRDYAVIMGTTLMYALIVTMANLFVDLAYAVVDPRIRYS